MTDKPLVFISYSKQDVRWKDGYLLVHLRGLEQAGMISTWSDEDIDKGGDWYQPLVQAMTDASAAVCLISPHYLATDFVLKEEIPYLLERESTDGLHLILLLVTPCDYEAHPWLAARQLFLPKGQSVEVDFKGCEHVPFGWASKNIRTRLKDRLAEPQKPEVSARLRAALATLQADAGRLETKPSSAHAQIQGNANIVVQVRGHGNVVSVVPLDGDPKERTPAWAPLASQFINLERLPETGAELFGRQSELRRLDDAWASATTNVVALVAWGGVGKSTLVRKWCGYLAADNFRGAGRVFAWSFYSQGSSERVASADEFVDAALTFFGDPEPEAGSAWSRGERLAGLVRAANGLLLLDGLEPLQDRYQGIKDPALGRLIEVLAADDAGDGCRSLCVITTRERVQELADFPETSTSVNLEQLSAEAGRALLRIKGVRGSDTALKQASRDFGNHALAISLLANYLRAIPGHPIGAADAISDLPEIADQDGRHPRRVMAAFVARFGEGPELELLCLLGLFDRPADDRCIAAMRRPPAIVGLTEHLCELAEADWLRLLKRLRDEGLLAPASHHAADELDAHPLVREHFGAWLKAERPEAWRAGHLRLFEHLQAVPEKHQPDTLIEMAPLLHAMGHGCEALRHGHVFRLYRDRVQRGDRFYSSKVLGLFGAELAASSSFFCGNWGNPSSLLNEEDRAFILNDAGVRLRALGRLREAVLPLQLGADIRIKREEWLQAAQILGNLSNVKLALGELVEAISLSTECVQMADQTADSKQKLIKRMLLADAYHQNGDFLKASNLASEALRIDCRKFPHILYRSIQGVRYLDILLSQSQFEKVLHDAYLDLDRATAKGIILDVALRRWCMGRAAQALGKTSEARSLLDQAVDGLRLAGTVHQIPRGLLARASLRRELREFAAAHRDLSEAHRLATRCEMRLHECDAQLELARLALAEGNESEALAPCERAAALVAATGYHRRDGELADLRTQLGLG